VTVFSIEDSDTIIMFGKLKGFPKKLSFLLSGYFHNNSVEETRKMTKVRDIVFHAPIQT
jgi:hypothetical protein